jgi:hypothetical protein
MFELHQKILLVNEEEGLVKTITISNMDNLAEDVVAACEKHNINYVRVHGNKNFSSSLLEEVNNITITKYGKNNIRIEVI